MVDDGSAATAMLGLGGFRLLAMSEYAGELEQAIATTAEVTGCPACGVVARLHARRPTWVPALPAGGRPVTLVWVKRVWRCAESACPQQTWTETSEAIRPRSSLTEQVRRGACRRVGEDGHSVAQVATAFGVGWGAVMRAVRDYGKPLGDDPNRLADVPALGVDETAFLAATATRPPTFVTGVVDLTGRPRLLDVLPARSAIALAGWVSGREETWRQAVTMAALDPFRGYAAALRTSLPHAVRVLDAFHVIRLGFDALDRVRRRVQQQTLGHRDRRDDPLFRIRRLLRRGFDHHSERSWARLLAGVEAGDVTSEIGKAWIAARDLRLLFRAARDRADAEQRLFRWLVHCADSGVPELHRLARTIDAWRDELVA